MTSKKNPASDNTPPPSSERQAPAPGLWKPEQAAAFLGLTPARLARMRSDGIGPAYVKFGRVIRYVPGECHRFVVSSTIRHD